MLQLPQCLAQHVGQFRQALLIPLQMLQQHGVVVRVRTGFRQRSFEGLEALLHIGKRPQVRYMSAPLRALGFGLFPLHKRLGQLVRQDMDLLTLGQGAGRLGVGFFGQKGQHMGHQRRRKLAMVEAQHQRELLRGAVQVLFIERGHQHGQQQDLAHGRDVLARQAARVARAIHAFVVLQHRDLHGAAIDPGLAHQQHGSDGMGHQMLA